MTTSVRPATVQAERLLVGAATFFTAAVLIHNFDHVRRGADAVSADVYLVGSAAILLEVAVVLLCMRRDRRAPALAALAGLSLAAGYLLVHFTPRRAWLSDSFLLEGTSPLSIAAASLEVLAAVTLGVAGIALLQGRLAGETLPQRSFRQALWHPITLAMVLGNIVVLGMSAAQRG